MSAPASWDTIIAGGGLAGTTLAWHLRDCGQRVLILDPGEPVTSSKIAAGLITPVTGQRLALSWRIEEFLPHARAFYTAIEQRTHRQFFHPRTAIRLFATDGERESWRARATKPEVQAHLLAPQPDPLLLTGIADTGGGGFAMNAAQLDVPAYLEASHAILDVLALKLDWQRDVELTGGGVAVGNQTARCLISCEGYGASANSYFSWLPFKAAKGDILTVRFEAPMPRATLHRGIWIAPTQDPAVFRVGATYDMRELDTVPSAGARAEIEAKLRDFVKLTYRVLDHQAAVRPIIHTSKAVAGLHPAHPQLGYFNGLGSKGSLHAPWYAAQFAQHLAHGTPMPSDLAVKAAR